MGVNTKSTRVRIIDSVLMLHEYLLDNRLQSGVALLLSVEGLSNKKLSK
jgi:hypothetical protein